MIHSLIGTVHSVWGDRLRLTCGNIVYDLRVSPADAAYFCLCSDVAVYVLPLYTATAKRRDIIASWVGFSTEAGRDYWMEWEQFAPEPAVALRQAVEELGDGDVVVSRPAPVRPRVQPAGEVDDRDGRDVEEAAKILEAMGCKRADARRKAQAAYAQGHRGAEKIARAGTMVSV